MSAANRMKFSVAICVFAVALLLGVSASAATINVSTSAQLVNAFATANANPNESYDVVLARGTYRPSSTLTLSSGYIRLVGSSSGANQASYVIDGGNARRVMEVRGRSVLLMSGVTLQNGYASDFGDAGGGLLVRDGALAFLDYSVIRNNRASYPGAGIAVSNAYASLSNMTLDGNTNRQYPDQCGGGATSGGGGLGIYSSATLLVVNSTFINNKACRGGGILVGGDNSTLYMENSTLSGNEALFRGGAMFFQGGTALVKLRFNTIAFNKAGTTPSNLEKRYGGGLGFLNYYGRVEAVGNVIAKNVVTYDMKNTLFYKGNDCYHESGSFTRQMRYNVIGEMANCSQFGSDLWPEIGSEVNPLDPKLGPLTTNGSTYGYQMLTHKPLAGSPLIGTFYAQNGALCTWDCPPWADQRGYTRPAAASLGRVDVGAIEYNGVR